MLTITNAFTAEAQVHLLHLSEPRYTENVFPGAQSYRPEGKNATTAVSTAIGSTFLPYGLGYLVRQIDPESPAWETAGNIMGTYGAVLGPSMGNFYADDYVRGFVGFISRAGSVAMMSYALRGDATGLFKEPYNFERTNAEYDTLLGAGAVLYAGTLVYNYITAAISANEYNEKFNVREQIRIETSSGVDPMFQKPVIRAKVYF